MAPLTPSPAHPQRPRRTGAAEEQAHVPKECPGFHTTTAGENKRCQRACKLCSRVRLHLAQATGAAPKRGKNTKWFCEECSNGNKRFYLCNIVRADGPHPSKTCFQVYHEDWNCGCDIPFEYQDTRTQMRAPGNKRKRRADTDDVDED